ncbi:MAG TPA: hypothetical protein VIX41_08865 [Acidimicrobiales bacterium]
MPEPTYVTPEDLTALVGSGADPARVERVCDTASRIVDHYYGAATVTAKLRQADGSPLDVVPSCVIEACLTIAVDVWRRPTTPGGYFQVADYVGRLSQDPTSPVVALLNALGREEWPIA